MSNVCSLDPWAEVLAGAASDRPVRWERGDAGEPVSVAHAVGGSMSAPGVGAPLVMPRPALRLVGPEERLASPADLGRRRLPWRWVALGLLTACTLVVLALPLRAVGGGSPAKPAGPPTVAGHEYTVQSGDTLWSIATRMDPGADPRATVARLESETGSDTVVPGERIRLP